MDCVLQCAYMYSIPTPLNPNPIPIPAPPIEIDLRYLAEGAANIVYSISIPEASRDSHPLLNRRLLRVRKNIPSAVPCTRTVTNFNTRIAPLFPPDSLIELILFELPQEGIIANLNRALREREVAGTRPRKRHGIYLTSQEEEGSGVLVTDMTPKLAAGEKLIEFKPKWLVQSPSAPLGARRCRSCALREMRRADEVAKGRGDAGFCPLDLLSTNEGVLRDIVKAIGVGDEDIEGSLTIWREKVQPLLLRLRDLQVEYNSVALSDFENGRGKDFSIPMTLRDCSVFIKTVKIADGQMAADVRLADLDLKTSSGGKLERWAETERRLIDGGWYQGEEASGSRGHSFCRTLAE